MTKQAASQLADEAEAAGFVERFADPSDRRRRRLRLTPRGEQVRSIALARSAALEAELAAEIGPEGVAACRQALIALVTRNGALDDVLARRSRMVR